MKIIKNNPDWLKSLNMLPEFDINFRVHRGHRQKVEYLWKAPSEVHNSFEIMYIISGLQKTKYSTTNVIYEMGDIIIIPPGLIHENQAISKWGLDYFCMHFDIDNPDIQNNLRSYCAGLVKKDTSLYLEIETHVKNFIKLLSKKDYTNIDKLQFHKLIIEFIISLLKYAKELEDRDILKSNDNSDLSKQIADKIHENYENFKSNPQRENKYLLTIQFLASNLGLSESTIFKAFKKSYGISPKNYISFLRYNDAKSMLSHSHLSIEDISQMSGFSDISNFSKQFKIWSNKTPSKYRKVYSEG